MDLLLNYHSTFLTKGEVKEIFRLTDRQVVTWTARHKWRKVGRKFLTTDIRSTLAELLEEAA
tara:strand:+ start:353 stop:538 length:186 start_codon:yes stop_codon:yes gene_type:complete